MKLSVVILNYNVRYFLELCLKSVEAALVGISAEIIVVDNASKDESCDMVESKFPKVKLIQNTDNFGFSKGNNQGVAVAKGEYICILNPDTVVAEDSFKILLNFAEDQPNMGILGCKLIDGQGQFLPESKRHIPTPKVSVEKMLGRTDGYYVPELANDAIGTVDILVGAFMVLKKEVYDRVGGFDEDYFMYGDDIDLSYKILKLGYQNMYNGQTTVIHYKGESTLKDKVYAQRFYGAMQIFYKKHFKSNLGFNMLVWLGVRAATLIQKPEKTSNKKQKHAVLISNEKHSALEKIYGTNLKVSANLESYQKHTTYILDNNHLSFKQMIATLEHAPKNSDVTFKILPKSSNFILGSNSAKHQGEVVSF